MKTVLHYLYIRKHRKEEIKSMKQENNKIKKIKSILPALGLTIIIALIVFAYIYVICSSNIPAWAKWLILTK